MTGHLCLLGDANSVHVQRWVGEMRARGWQVSVVTARPHPIEGVRQVVLPPVRRTTDWLWRVGAARRAVAELKPDIVHAHYVTSYGYLAARSGRHPLVMTAWGSDLLVTPKSNVVLRLLTAWILGQADLVTGDSPDLLAAAHELRNGLSTELIHWGVDLARFSPRAWEEKPGCDAVSLRSWEPNYRIDVILQALAHVRKKRSDVRLHLLGGGSLEGALRAQVSELGLQDAVRFHGKLDDAGMAAVLDRCRFSISVPESDATSVSVLESMACGLAVIASDLPANRDWLPAGALVPAGDAGALAERWETLVQDDEQASFLGECNAERIVLEGDRQAQMNAMDRLYRRLLGSDVHVK